MTRATVTGASGLVGANLLRSLLDRGIEVCAADLRRSPALDGLDVDFVEVNVRDRSSLAAAFDGADVVFHLAAILTGEVVVAMANCRPALSASSISLSTPGRRLTAPLFTAAS